MAPTSSFSSAFLVFLLLAIVVKEAASQMPWSEEGGAEWNYDATSPHGPENWSDNYTTCGGQSQSPINIAVTQVTGDSVLTDFEYDDYDSTPSSNFELKNTGSSIQLSVPVDWKSEISGGGLKATYRLSQLHFHWGKDNHNGSEHLLDGKAHPLEIHLVHWNTNYESFDESLNFKDGVAVLGVFAQVTSSSASSALGNLTTHFHRIPHSGNVTEVPPFALRSLLPEQKTYYRYEGSLTTPACQQIVTWSVFHHPISLNETEMAKFRTIYDYAGKELLHNFRPTQPLHTRTVSTYSGSTMPHQPTASAALLTTLSVVMAIVTHQWLF